MFISPRILVLDTKVDTCYVLRNVNLEDAIKPVDWVFAFYVKINHACVFITEMH